MAGDWIKMRADLADDPAVFKLRLAIGDDRLQIVGRLHLFWAWADKHAVDGVVDGATSQLVDDVACKEGFAAALVAVKWLVITDKGILLPNSDRHNGESAKERTLKNQRQARWRERKAAGAVDATPSTKTSTNASTREEKRREEVDTSATDLFEQFYEAYPRRVGKDAARKAFAKRSVDAALLTVMVAAIQRQGLKAKCAKGESQYVPHPATWLNEGRWQDEDGTAAPVQEHFV